MNKILQHWLTTIGFIGLLTAATLPGRNTVGLLQAIQKLISGTMNTAIVG